MKKNIICVGGLGVSFATKGKSDADKFMIQMTETHSRAEQMERVI